ncbi:MAG: ATP-binding cassette domain-containing protein [Rhodospirillales bacterium]
MSAPVIETVELCKRYGARLTVDHLNLRIEPGTVFGLLGPNGSGKTTTILMLMGLTEISSGIVRVVGLDPRREPLAVKRLVGYMPDSVGFYDQLTARQNLRFSGRLAGVPADVLDKRIDAVLERVALGYAVDQRAGTFSRGMRQRLGLADVLLKEPRVAILDEPTSGLDPRATHEFLELILALKAEGLTILLTSHLLDRVQAVCDRVGLFRDGRLELEGTVDDLAKQVLGARYRILLELHGHDAAEDTIRAVPGVVGVARKADGAFELQADQDVRPAVVAAVTRAGGAVYGLSIREPSLDEIYNRHFAEVGHAA